MSSQNIHEELIQFVILNVKKNLGEEITLRLMSDLVFLSPFHFNRVFRKVTGLPPKEFLSALRIEKSKELLVKTDLRITDICVEVGFNSLGTFTNRFRNYVGVGPKEYRNGLRLNTIYNNNEPKSKKIVGTISTENINEPIFIGLFNKPIPQGKPISCTIIEPGSKSFQINVNQYGKYYLFAVSERHSKERLQGSAGPFLINGTSNHFIELNLTAPKDTDPPILVSLPINITDSI